MARREYRGAAAPLVLDVAVNAGALSVVTTGDVTGWPTGATNPFYVEIDRTVAGKAEKLLVTSRSGNTLTVATRGADGTTAVSHSPGAVVEHVLDSLTVDEVNAHVNDDTLDDHSQYLTTGRHDATARHLLGTSVPAGTPGASAPGDTASQGVATSAARSDHRHAREVFGATGVISNSANGDTAYGGASAAVARADHRHAREGFGTPAASAPGDVNTAGVDTNPARSDHKHGREAWGASGDIAASAPGNTALAGSTGKVADAGHRHPREETLGLTQNQDKNDGDTSVIVAASSLVVATYTLVTTKRRIIPVHAYCQIRNNVAASGSFSGYAQLVINGVVMFGAQKRFNSFPLATAVLPISFSTQTVQDAGTYVVTLLITTDPAVPDIVVSCRDLDVLTIGG